MLAEVETRDGLMATNEGEFARAGVQPPSVQPADQSGPPQSSYGVY
jgi:hypothetical protein